MTKILLLTSLVIISLFIGLDFSTHQALAVPVSYNQTAISIPWTVQARNGTVTDLFTNNDTRLLWAQFNGNLIDSSNYYNNLTSTGSISYEAGQFNQAIKFAGFSYLNINNAQLPTGNAPFTTSFWVYYRSFSGSPVIICWGNHVGTHETTIYTSTTGRIELYDGTNYAFNTSLSLNTWNHIVITFDGTTLKAYENGVQDTFTFNPTFTTTLNNAIIGSYFDKTQPLTGDIEDLNIFNRVVSQTDRTIDFNTGIYPTHPTLITNWYHYTNTASKIGLKLGTNTNNLVLSCTPYSTSLAIQGENILYDCTKSGSTTRQINTDSINTFSNSSSVMFHSNGCESSSQDFSTWIFPTATYIHSFCFGGSASGFTNNGTATTFSGNNTVYSGLNNPNSPTIANGQIFLSGQKFALSSTYASNTFLRFNSNTTSTNDINISLFTTDLCDMSSMPGYTLRQISIVGCDPSIGANQIHYLNGTQMLQVNNYYSNNTLPFFSSIQDNQYKSALTLIPNIMGITAPYTDFILYTPTANYMVVLTGTPLSGNIYYVNVNTITSLLAKNYAYQSYMMTTQSTTSSFGIVNTNMGQTVRLYGPSNLNTTTNIGGLFTVTSPYQIQAFASSTSNGQTRILDPQWTNVPATNYPIIWTSPQLLYPVYLTVSNAPVDGGLMVTNNNVAINGTQQTWAILRLDSTHSGEYDVPPGTCQNIYVADISIKPAIYNYEGSTCATGVNQKTLAYTNTLPFTFWTFKYGASDTYTPTNNGLQTFVRAQSAPFIYNVVIKNSTGTVKINSTFTANSTLDTQSFNLTSLSKPASLTISVAGQQIYSAFLGSPVSLASASSFFAQYFTYDGFNLLSMIPIVFASMFTRNTVGIGTVATVLLIATLSWLSISVVSDLVVTVSVFISVIGLIAYRVTIY